MPFNYHDFDHMDEDALLDEWLALKKLNVAYDSPEGLRQRQLKLALDCKHGYHIC